MGVRLSCLADETEEGRGGGCGLQSIVVPVTVHHVQNTQGKFQAPSLTTPAAVDQWSRERNAWVHSLVYSAKAATDKVAAGTLTLAPVEGFKCVSEEQEDQARRGLEMQMRRKGMEAGTHGVAGLMRIMRCDPYAGSKRCRLAVPVQHTRRIRELSAAV